MNTSGNIVFNSFVNMLLTTTAETADIYDSQKFDVWFTSKGKHFNNNTDLTFNNATKNMSDTYKYIGKLDKPNIKVISSTELTQSKVSYNSLLNIPASAYIFSKYDKPEHCEVLTDINYSALNYHVSSYKILNNCNPSALPYFAEDNTISSYFSQIYSFDSNYNKTEYYKYNISENYLTENMVKMVSNSKSFSGSLNGFPGGALMISWSKNAIESVNLYESTDNPTSAISGYLTATIPFMYIELPRTYNVKNNEMQITWPRDGMFTLE